MRGRRGRRPGRGRPATRRACRWRRHRRARRCCRRGPGRWRPASCRPGCRRCPAGGAGRLSGPDLVVGDGKAGVGAGRRRGRGVVTAAATGGDHPGGDQHAEGQHTGCAADQQGAAVRAAVLGEHAVQHALGVVAQRAAAAGGRTAAAARPCVGVAVVPGSGAARGLGAGVGAELRGEGLRGEGVRGAELSGDGPLARYLRHGLGGLGVHVLDVRVLVGRLVLGPRRILGRGGRGLRVAVLTGGLPLVPTAVLRAVLPVPGCW